MTLRYNGIEWPYLESLSAPTGEGQWPKDNKPVSIEEMASLMPSGPVLKRIRANAAGMELLRRAQQYPRMTPDPMFGVPIEQDLPDLPNGKGHFLLYFTDGTKKDVFT